jgi:DHA3 family tetracycline resistance protein-like MFS transporter
VQHSHEALDRPGGLARVNLLAPLRHRDFRRLWAGMTVSLVGDGAFLVAMAWQVYALSNAASALSLVGIAMTVPTILLLLLGGVVSDRLDRRRVMLSADLVRGAAVGALAVLALTHEIEVWHVAALAGLYGAGTAFFTPAFDAVVPELLEADELAPANALDQLVRPVAFRLIGPLLGGLLVGWLGAGLAFALDAGTFVVSAAAVASMSMRGRRAAPGASSVTADIREGLRFVRGHVWLWGTLVSAAIAYLVFMGPAEVLLPYMVKNEVHAGATQLGLVFASGGIGAIACALVMGQRGLPRRTITWMYVAWTLATVAVAGYGLAQTAWQLMAACLVFNVLETAGTIIWATVKQQHVPERLLGRVSSLDWLISIGLLPLSFALTGPVVDLIGPRATLVGAGVVGGIVTLSALFLPGMRSIEPAATYPRLPGRKRSADQTSSIAT